MSDRYFRLMERHQKLDEVLRLRSLKAAVRDRLAALFLRRPEAVLATV